MREMHGNATGVMEGRSFAPELRHARPKPAHDGHVDLWQSRRAQARDERAAPVTTELLVQWVQEQLLNRLELAMLLLDHPVHRRPKNGHSAPVRTVPGRADETQKT